MCRPPTWGHPAAAGKSDPQRTTCPCQPGETSGSLSGDGHVKEQHTVNKWGKTKIGAAMKDR